MGTKTNQADQESRYLIGFVIILATMCCACYQFFPVFFPKCEKTSGEPRELTATENFEENWSISEMYLSASDSAIFMAANKNRILAYGAIDAPCGNPLLIGIDTDSGEILHKGVRFIPTNQGIYHTAYNSDYFYLGYNGPGKAIEGSTLSAGGIAAYEINTSELHWTRKIPGTRSIYALVANSDTVAIDGGMFSDYYHLVNGRTGEIIFSLDKFTSGLPGSGSRINMAYWYDYMNIKKLNR